MKEQCPDIVTLKGTLDNVELGGRTFDVIMFYHVIEHLENPKKELKILYKILKRNGVLIVGTPNVQSLAGRIFKKNFRLFAPGHLCLYNKNSLTWLLKENGFTVFKREYPFWRTDYATLTNIFRMFNPSKISPPFYGSLMTFYARKD
jgi:SAM-dependent methyltransferase